jgi:hypothetical protein
VNPRIGSDLQYGRTVEEEESVEVVRNHEGGTRMGIGVPISKAVSGEAETPSWSSRESDSSILYDGGAIFGQPHERKPGFAAGSQGPKRVGKVGVKVRRVARVRTKVMASGPIEGPRGPECGDAFQGRGGQQ